MDFRGKGMIKSRIKKLRGKLSEYNADAFLITSYENYRYFSGFTGSNCNLLIGNDFCIAITDGRYDIQIRSQAPDYEAIIASGGMSAVVAEVLKEKNVRFVGYETEWITDSTLRAYKNAAGSCEFIPVSDIGAELRAIKDESEINFIRNAVKCSDDAFCALVSKLSKGMTERESAALLEYEMAKRGSTHPAFDTIAASGLRSAMPHATPQDIEIPDNCLMTFDFGATVSGYMSDITRTVHIGTPSKELCELWDIVFDVQQKCISYIRCGMSARELDEYQRSLFAKAGMDKYIMHSLGHGVGLAIHEMPTVSKRSDATLCKNMIITVEPGLYIENLGGVRIEDTVLITDNGGIALTGAPHRINITF